MNRLSPNRRPLARSRGGFTLIELLTVMIIIAVLVGLLLPAITAALKSARNAAVSSEIGLLAQALESFKSRYGDYPPSRVILSESGSYLFAMGNNPPPLSNFDPTSPTGNDISVTTLAQRTLVAMRKFFPRVVFTTTAALAPGLDGTNTWYDFNGNGLPDANPYVLHGHECLVFFLGGIPSPTLLPASGSVVVPASEFGMSGFGKDPTNPFGNNIIADNRLTTPGPNPMYRPNRQPPLFEFNAGRLFLDPNGASGIPGYYDSLSSDPPTGSNSNINFYAYFSAYGNNAYDANDVNFSFESDPSGNNPIALTFQHGSATYLSPSPNPYTTTFSTTATSTGTSTGTAAVVFQKPQTYQIFSSGVDGLYGVGGQYVAPGTSSASNQNPLPVDGNGDTFSAGNVVAGGNIRSGEKDNLTNFKAGTLN